MESNPGGTSDQLITSVDGHAPSAASSTDAVTIESVSADQPSQRRYWLYRGVLAGVLFLLLFVGMVLMIDRESHVPVRQFAATYALVPEKISKSAPIYITLPTGVTETMAQAGTSFSPNIEGTWLTEEIEQVVVFQPKQPLQMGMYYAVNVDTEAAQVSADFYVDEDPQITAIFPVAGSESHEDSEITIVFNRPMVPLTTLSMQEAVTLPITITPPTAGTFKWISTRNLQFIPETTLVPSSEYTVVVAEGLVSVDGLPVAPMTHSFVTRPLRYEHISSESIGYRSPIHIRFNQPVDLEQTRDQITVTTLDGRSVPVSVAYGETTYYDSTNRTYVTETDPSVLFVYQTRDQHGRKNLWDFDTSYSVSITGAEPLAGNRSLTEGRKSVVTVPDIIAGVSAESERSTLVRPDLFDPAGTLKITFYDAVSIDRSDIQGKGLKQVVYGERCKTDERGEPISLGSGCEKETDTETLLFTFHKDAFVPGESFALDLRRIVTPDGFRITEETTTIPLTIYPALEILYTVPRTSSVSASAGDGIYLCTNVPLREPSEGYVDEYIKTDGYIVYGRMQRSRYVAQKFSQYDKCNTGEFETWFQMGLLPETFYSFDLSVIDVFDQSATGLLALTTAPAEAKYTRFHNLQKQYNVTPPDRTTLTYAVENLEYIDMHICRLEPEQFLERTVKQDGRFTPPSSVDCTSVVTKQITLPARYWVNNYFQVDLATHFSDPRGHYIITFSHPLYTDVDYSNRTRLIRPLYDRTYVSVTNLAIGRKAIEFEADSYSQSENPDHAQVRDDVLARSSNLYWVNTNNTLEPVANATVQQFQGNNKTPFQVVSTNLTDVLGVARAPIQTELSGVVVRAGADSAVLTDWADTLQGAGMARDASRTYVYTDRPIYRPGHTVHIRGIDRVGFDGSYEVLAGQSVPLEIFDAGGARVYEVQLTQSQYGTFSTSFDLPSDAALGSYRIVVFGQSFPFAVEEYVPAAFQLEAETNQTEYTNGDDLRVVVQADYYFGVPLSEGTVSYAVTAQDYYFDRFADEYFNFGQAWYECYSCGYGDEFLFRGEVPIDAQGRAVIERQLDLKDYFSDLASEGSKLVTVSITAKDINGRSVSLQKSFILHKGEFYIGAKTDQYYTGLNAPVNVRVKTVDQQGLPTALSGIERVVYKVDWETFKRQEVDGGFYYRSEKRLTEISREQVRTSGDGDWAGEISFIEAGQYEIHVSKSDSRGNQVMATTYVYIYGSEAVSMPPNNNYELDLEAQRTQLDVGETASLLIKSPYQKAKALITAERGTVYEYWIVDISSGLYVHEFPVKSEYAPNVFVSVLLLSDDPEVKYGSIRYDIGSQEQRLSVIVTADKDFYLPGEMVTLNVATQDFRNQPVSAEVSLAVADLSVLALKGNPKKNPAQFFYDGFPLAVSTASNIRNILHEVDVPLGTKGGGGASPDDLAAKKRGLFKDTAYWSANVVTNTEGRAQVRFTLPDNLTTWQIEALAVTEDTKLGVAYQEFTTKKDLMAVPLKPRFVVPGDQFALGATVYNQTSQGETVEVKLESPTLAFVDEADTKLYIEAGQSAVVYFDVVAPKTQRAGAHTFTFTATAQQLQDSVEQSIAITPNMTYETVATANFTTADRVTEYIYIPDIVLAGEGGLTINANATLAVFMTDAVSYMVTYPYGCSEQLASSLSTIGILTSALSLPNVSGELDTITHEGVTYTVSEVVDTGLATIYETQTLSGGFAYYKGLEPNLNLTLHVVDALAKLQLAGYTVRTDVLEHAVTYIESETRRVYARSPKQHRDMVIATEYILRTVSGDSTSALTPLLREILADTSFLNEQISSLSLAYLAIITTDGFSRTIRDTVYDLLKNRIAIDGRGAYLATPRAARGGFFETPIKNTALLLKVFAAHNDEHPAMANVLRWLLASRDHRGVWGSTHNTFSVVDSMVTYLQWQEESTARFSVRGLLRDSKLFDFEFNPSTVFSTFSHQVPIDDIPRNTLMPIILEKTELQEQTSNLYYDVALKYYLPVDSLPPRDEGITITRHLYSLGDTRKERPITQATVGDVVKGSLTITIPDEYTHVSIEDIIPAGFELINFNLATEDQSLRQSSAPLSLTSTTRGWLSSITSVLSSNQSAQVWRARGHGGSYGNEARELWPTHSELHDDRVFLYVEQLSPGVYEYEYFMRALVPGEFQHLPARAEELFFPEVFGRTAGGSVTITAQ